MSRKPRRQSGKQSSRPKTTASAKAVETPQTETRSTADIVLEESGPNTLPGVEWLATSGRYISAERLAVVIESNPGQPLPDGLRDYLCRFLRGKVKQKRGRKKTDYVIEHFTEFVVRPAYEQELRRLQAERKARGREIIGKGHLTPHEEAIRIIKERFSGFYAPVSPRRIANMLSSRKFGR